MSKMCFQINNGRFFCIPVPIREFPKRPIPIEFSKPDPWFESSVISPEVVSDISVLASINELVKTLETPILQKQFTQSLHDAMSLLELPNDVRMSFDDLQGAPALRG
jgi:hypothetical protein